MLFGIGEVGYYQQQLFVAFTQESKAPLGVEVGIIDIGIRKVVKEPFGYGFRAAG